MRIHLSDLEHEIEKARRELDTLVDKRTGAENALAMPGTARWLVNWRVREIEAEIDEVKDYLRILEDPDILESCSSVARAAGCTCTLRSVSPDHPPEAIRSRHCPLHGEAP